MKFGKSMYVFPILVIVAIVAILIGVGFVIATI